MTSNDEQTTGITDAQMAARWAAIALEEGRYELGRALANLAASAARITYEQPRGPVDLDTWRAAETAQTEVFPVQEQQLAVPESGRCKAGVTVDGVAGTCAAVCYWTETPGANGHTGAWHHVDPALDHDHVPYVR